MIDKAKMKNIAYFIGKSLGILGLLYLFYTLYQEYTWSSFTHQFLSILHLMPLLFALNIVSILLGIYAWHIILLHYTQKPFSFLASYYYYTKTDIAKYLPGNVFHYLGRQALASKIGMSQKEMAKTSMLLSLLLLISTIISSFIFALFSQNTPTLILTFMGLSSMITLISVRYVYPSFPIRRKIVMNAYLALSIALQGVMLGIIVMYQSDAFTMSLFFQCASIYILSWLIGFVTPGASGGLGVREGIFIAITNYLHIDISAEIIIFSVLLVRLINICVDVLLYLGTFGLEKKIKELKL